MLISECPKIIETFLMPHPWRILFDPQEWRNVCRSIRFLIPAFVVGEKKKLNQHQVLLLQRLALNKFKRISIDEYAEETTRSHEMARLELKSILQTKILQEFKVGKKLFYRVDSKILKELLSMMAWPKASFYTVLMTWLQEVAQNFSFLLLT